MQWSQFTSSVSGVSLLTDQPHGRVTFHGCTVRSPVTGCQVTSSPHDRFSRYSKWPDTFWTALVCVSERCVALGSGTTDSSVWYVYNRGNTDDEASCCCEDINWEMKECMVVLASVFSLDTSNVIKSYTEGHVTMNTPETGILMKIWQHFSFLWPFG